MTLGGSEGMLSRAIFENLYAVMAIIVLFERFSDIFCLQFWSLILSASPNMMYFVCIVSIMRAYRRLRYIVIKRFKIMEKSIHPKHC